MRYRIRDALVPAAMAAILTACGASTALPSAGAARTGTAVPDAAGSPQPYQLYTHCGIGEARIGNRYYAAVHPPSDRAGNPPPGWGNPYQDGTMTLQAPDTAVFRDAAGHSVLFRLRPGATAFQHTCS